MLRRFKAVFFDAGGTLLHPFPSVGEIYREVAERYGWPCQAKELENCFRKAWLRRDGLSDLASHCDEKIEKKWWQELVREVFSQTGDIRKFKKFDIFFEELYHLFGSPEVWRVYPGTEKILKEIRGKKSFLGIISNWDSRLFHLCDGLCLSGYFNVILASAVVGSAKPGSRIFEEALKKAGIQPHEAVHIGDSFEDDVRGALKAGMEAILINRHPERTIDYPVPAGIPVIHDLSELLDEVPFPCLSGRQAKVPGSI